MVGTVDRCYRRIRDKKCSRTLHVNHTVFKPKVDLNLYPFASYGLHQRIVPFKIEQFAQLMFVCIRIKLNFPYRAWGKTALNEFLGVADRVFEIRTHLKPPERLFFGLEKSGGKKLEGIDPLIRICSIKGRFDRSVAESRYTIVTLFQKFIKEKVIIDKRKTAIKYHL